MDTSKADIALKDCSSSYASLYIQIFSQKSRAWFKYTRRNGLTLDPAVLLVLHFVLKAHCVRFCSI